MAEKKYYWLKLKADFFDEKYIRALRRLPQGDSLVIVYLKMQLKSLKTEGLLQYEHILPDAISELALLLDEDETLVQLAVNALIKFGVVERWDNGDLYFTAMQQLIGSETSVAARVRKHRALQNKDKALPCNANVTKCNTDIDIDIEKDTERDKEKIYISDGFQNFLDMVKEVCPVVYRRYQNKIDSGNLEAAREVKRLLDTVLGRTEEFWAESDFDELKEVFVRASQTYIVKPKYAGLDIAWVLNNIEKVKNTPIEQQTSAAPKAEKFDAMACLQELYEKHKAEEENND